MMTTLNIEERVRLLSTAEFASILAEETIERSRTEYIAQRVIDTLSSIRIHMDAEEIVPTKGQNETVREFTARSLVSLDESVRSLMSYSTRVTALLKKIRSQDKTSFRGSTTVNTQESGVRETVSVPSKPNDISGIASQLVVSTAKAPTTTTDKEEIDKGASLGSLPRSSTTLAGN